jgi:hypothetical protein
LAVRAGKCCSFPATVGLLPVVAARMLTLHINAWLHARQTAALFAELLHLCKLGK